MNHNRYSAHTLRDAAVKTLTENGLSSAHALILADCMTQADRRGVTTHGLRMMNAYVQKLHSGAFETGDILIRKQTSAFTLVDAHNMIGAVSAYQCVQLAIEQVRSSGIHMIFARNCNTFGPAFYFAEAAARNGMIGLVCCNSPAAMPAFHGTSAILGTNPLAFACPSESEGIILFDMASSAAAKSKFALALSNGETIPEGWALDAQGQPVTDPAKAIRGLVLPAAGFKGYGLAVMIDILSGVLSGAGYLNRVNKFYSDKKDGMNAGQFFCVMDPAQIYDGDFGAEMDMYIRILRASGDSRKEAVVVPGDRGEFLRRQSDTQGIPVDEETENTLHLLICGGGGNFTNSSETA